MGFRLFKIGIVAFIILNLTGCYVIFQKGTRSDRETIEQLSQQLNDLKQAQRLLEQRLSQEIKDKQVSLKMMEKGLVITFLADILFDSGKDKIRPEAYSILSKVARVLNENVPDLKVGIEGYTDNEPIRFSGWKSNWELSSARALSVLHYLSDKENVESVRLSAIGYGEFQPVASNETREGRQLNRRVEVVILPQVTKVKKEKDTGLSEPQENLK